MAAVPEESPFACVGMKKRMCKHGGMCRLATRRVVDVGRYDREGLGVGAPASRLVCGAVLAQCHQPEIVIDRT